MPAMYWESPFTGAEFMDTMYRTPAEKAQFELELKRLIEVHIALNIHMSVADKGLSFV